MHVNLGKSRKADSPMFQRTLTTFSGCIWCKLSSTIGPTDAEVDITKYCQCRLQDMEDVSNFICKVPSKTVTVSHNANIKSDIFMLLLITYLKLSCDRFSWWYGNNSKSMHNHLEVSQHYLFWHKLLSSSLPPQTSSISELFLLKCTTL